MARILKADMVYEAPPAPDQIAQTTFPLLIPLDACPPEMAVLGQGRTVGLRVQGRLTPAGVLVDSVELIR